MFRRQRPLWQTYRPEQRPATRRREVEARFTKPSAIIFTISVTDECWRDEARVTACQSLLLTPERKEFLEDLVTEDESWVLYNNDTHRAVWIPRGEEPPVQPKANLSLCS
uniref:Uncharacterized protein n=1 Tax=Caenorhabditis japonica TaxID=281687 RepID=A0A8R1E2Y0_CAEJA